MLKNSNIIRNFPKIKNCDKISIDLSLVYDNIDVLLIYNISDSAKTNQSIDTILTLISKSDNTIPIYITNDLSFYNKLLTKIYNKSHIKPIHSFVAFIKILDDKTGQIFKIYTIDEFIDKLLTYIIT